MSSYPTNNLTESFEQELRSLDESSFPDVMMQRMETIALVNEKFENAQKKKDQAQTNINNAMKRAEELILQADALGETSPKIHKRLITRKEYIKDKDRFDAIESALKDLGEYGSETAKYQKQLADVQGAALESQTSIMEVQKCQMEYLECTSEVLKFLYGLSAYGIASTQSIVTNLELVLSGAKKKDLGEMAKQQMFLVMDQLKSQENLQHRVDKNKKSIVDLKERLELQEELDERYRERIENVEKNEKKQDELLLMQIKKDKEHDQRLKEQAEKDKEHDQQLKEQAEKDKEHDQRLKEQTEKDKEHDQRLKEQVEKDIEHDQRLKEQVEKDIEHDQRLKEQENKLLELEQLCVNQSDIINSLERKIDLLNSKNRWFIIGVVLVQAVVFIYLLLHSF